MKTKKQKQTKSKKQRKYEHLKFNTYRFGGFVFHTESHLLS